MAEQYKAKGNDYFSQGDYERAAEQYTTALSNCRADDKATASKIFSNRALCHLKLNNHQYAEADATAALREDPTNIKALRHRGMARMNIDGQQELAIADLESFVERGGTLDKKTVHALQKLKGGVDALSRLSASTRSSTQSSTRSSTQSSTKEEQKEQKKVQYTVEKIGEGDIFDLWRVQFVVPREGLNRLSGGRASVQVRGGSFELVANPESGCVETTIETPDPTLAADAIAERIHLRINSNDSFSGMDACFVM